MNKPKIRILHHMARTGGTLICKCLGSMQHVMLLSEIHPATGHLFNPLKQAAAWFGLFSEQEVARILARGIRFQDAIAEIQRRAEASGHTLVLRDWSHIDFTGKPFNQHPGYRFVICDVLQQDFTLCNTCTVRHPVAQYLSLSKLQVMQGQLGLDEFLFGYLQFARHSVARGFIRYEDFTDDPDRTLETLCARLELEYDAGYRQRWPGYTTITGDTQNAREKSDAIHPSRKRKTYPAALLERFAANRDYHEALALLGYEHPSAA